MSRSPRVLPALAAALLAVTVGTIAAPASRADAEPTSPTPTPAPAPTLPEWSGSVLGGTPLQFPSPSRSISFASISPGANFSLGLDTEGNAWAWGINGFGQLGNSEYVGRFVFAPYPVPMLDSSGKQLRAIDLAASGNFSIALDEAGKAWTYGRNNFGQLGNPAIPDDDSIAGEVTPVAVVDATGRQMVFQHVSAGVSFGFGLAADGSAWAWGRDSDGQLGGGPNANVFVTAVSTVATPVLDDAGNQMKFASIAGGEDFAIAIDLDGKAWGWGDNSVGQLGSDGPSTDRPRPVVDANGTQLSFTQVTAGYANAYGLDSDGHVWSWGQTTAGALGNTTATDDTSVPIPVLGESGDRLQLTSVSTWDESVFGVGQDGQVWAWGNNADGQLGRDPGALPSSAVPLLLYRSPGVPLVADQVYAGSEHATMIGAFDPTTLTNAWAWGAAWYGQLGNPDVDTSASAHSLTPVTISLPQPSASSLVYFGDDDTVGVTGAVVDGDLVVRSPRHLAGRVPVYVAWFGDEPSKELVGYFTFLLSPTLVMQPSTLDIDATSQAVVTVPAAEVPLIGAAKIRFTLGDGHLTVPGGDPAAAPPLVAFDATGRAALPVTSAVPGTYSVSALAVIDEPADPITDGVTVSGTLDAPITFLGYAWVTPPTSTWYGSVTVDKMDEQHQPLTGAKFAVYYSHAAHPDFGVTDDPDTGAVLTTSCDMTSGNATSCTVQLRFSDHAQGVWLDPGDPRWDYYWLVEVTAPAGYELLADPIPFQITKENTDAYYAIPDIDVVDVPSAGIVLPFTGSNGSAAMVFTGVGLGLVTAATLLVVRRRRARKD